MKIILLVLFSFASVLVDAQSPAPVKEKPVSVCEAFTKMKAAGETNFIAFTKEEYVDGTSSYHAKYPVPGFDENKVEVSNLLKMYYTSGMKYYKTLEEASAAFNKTKTILDECFSDKGTDVKTAKRPHGNKWVSQHKDFLNNIYQIELTLGVFQNTKTLEWALEYFMMKK